MLRGHFIVKGVAILSLLFSFYYVTSQRAFENFLDTLNITFDDFPQETSTMNRPLSTSKFPGSSITSGSKTYTRLAKAPQRSHR
ncbi:predicted protein [Plenodomus lingam JN3]|uniref:Predicted protein n=1 Tax=Leptosphaeria maculans (strain JN3 / isolate v23.1.3 / race Av1-4-5-6-7-8) TaxID=985895 RepID=E4ZJA3_LEPMJ|nr:predicted protein [Plenodomus lingam JN3]CBX91534.1 predicted protein [Plenodomus lingam JN3]